MGILGPLRVEIGGRPIRLTTGRLRTLLVGLAMSAGQAVSADRLTRVMWAEDLPADPRRSLQTYAARLRTVVGERHIETVPAGWLLRADPDQVDALRFARLLDESAAAAPDAERDLLAGALTLWRGEPFDGVESTWLARVERPQLVERYLAALERRVDLDLRCGVVAEQLIAELETLTARYPLRESLWVRLMTLLDRGGRPAEALRRYEDVRRRIAEELGIDPSPELRALHAHLLAGKPADGGRRAPFFLVPRQLPPDIAGFAGRHDALATLDRLLAARPAGRAPGVAVLTGAAGVGKTALIVRWINRVAAGFPDGQLYCDLRGFDARLSPVRPEQVIRGFLTALGVAPDEIPPDTAGRVAMYRSITAGKRLLVVLDNARSAEQVRPLLATGDSAFAVVTSRNRLTGLVVSGAAQPVPLRAMTAEESRELLRNRVELPDTRDAEVAVDEIVRLCAGLPLALASTAARLTTAPRPHLAVVAAGLRDARGRLDLLDSGDVATSVRAAFSWSYEAISPPAAELFRLSGLHPGPELSQAAAASLAGIPVRHARRRLAELADAHLLIETAPGRYALDNLLRIYARELAELHDPEADRRAATRRMLDHYLHTACAGSRVLSPDHRAVVRLPPAAGVPANHLRALG